MKPGLNTNTKTVKRIIGLDRALALSGFLRAQKGRASLLTRHLLIIHQNRFSKNRKFCFAAKIYEL